MNALRRVLDLIGGRQDFALVLVLMTSISVMIIPVPPSVLDALITLNIALTVLVLIVSIYLDRPTDFSTFPAVILIATTFRLSISLSTTRSVLTEAEAGAIVETFGTFVTGGNLVVGFVMFLVITIVQFVVITRGAERIAEVAARFVLDALPGRQMSIDAELRAGTVDQDEGRRRRELLDKENQFFGAMDGAMKFVKGDAIAGLLIVAVNLIGGIAVGVLQRGISIGEATSTYSLLTIGDGLVAQIPALLLALCSGTVVTRVTHADSSDLGGDIVRELIGSARTLMVAGVAVTLIGLVPGFPFLFFLTLGAALIWMSFLVDGQHRLRARAATEKKEAEATQNSAGPTATQAEAGANDRMTIRLGSNAAKRVDTAGFIAARETVMEQLAASVGFELSRFGIVTDPLLGVDAIVIDLDDVPLFSTQIPHDQVALRVDPKLPILADVKATPLPRIWPVLGAMWIDETSASRLAEGGIEAMTTAELVVETAGALMRRNLSALVGFEEVQHILRQLRAAQPQLVEQVTASLSTAKILDILRRLLDEGVPLAPHRTLFEALSEWVAREDDPTILAEHARRALRRQICYAVADENRVMPAYIVEPDLEQALRGAMRKTEAGMVLTPPPALANDLLEQLETVAEPRDTSAPRPVIVTALDLRRHLRNFLNNHNLEWGVLSFQEIAPEFFTQPVGTLTATRRTQSPSKAA